MAKSTSTSKSKSKTKSDPRAEALAKLNPTWRALAEHAVPVPGTVCGETVEGWADFVGDSFRFYVRTESGAVGNGETMQKACVDLAEQLGRTFSDSAPRAFREGLKAAGHDYSANLNTRAPRGNGGGSLGIGRKPSKASVSVSIEALAYYCYRQYGGIEDLGTVVADCAAYLDSDGDERRKAGAFRTELDAVNTERLAVALAKYETERKRAEQERIEAREAAEVGKVAKLADRAPDSERAKRCLAVISLRGLGMDNGAISDMLAGQGASEDEVSQAFADASGPDATEVAA